jgi:hypothetical protein
VAYPVVIQILNRNAGDLFYAGHGPIGSCLEVTFRKGLGCSVGKPMDFMIFTQYVIYIYDIYIYINMINMIHMGLIPRETMSHMIHFEMAMSP